MFFGRTEVFRAGPAPLTLVSLGGVTQQEPADDWDPWGQFLYSPKSREWSMPSGSGRSQPPPASRAMIDWFTPQFRMTSLEALKAYATGRENILGTLLVGSGARGFTDQYSDIDVVFVAEDEASAPGVVDDLASWLPKEFKLVFMTTYRHEPDIFVICLITENGLELDVGVWSLLKLRATKPDWKLIQSRSPMQDQLITAAMQQAKPSSKRTGGTEIYGDDPLWQSVNRLAVARLRRNLPAIANAEAVLLDKFGGTDNETIINSARKVYVNPRQLQFIESLGIGL